jgi:hypothetical protein
MSSFRYMHFPGKIQKRYAELLLRFVYQRGGRERYVPISEIEDALGLEQAWIVWLCRTRLLGEVFVTNRLPADLEESLECRTPVECEYLRLFYSRPHVRVRSSALRLTEEELLSGRKKRSKKKSRDACRG